MSLSNKIKDLPEFFEVEVKNLTEDELNQTKGCGFDSTWSFRKELIEQNYTIKKLIARYYRGWECDEWAAIIADSNGNEFKASTTNGELEIEDV